MLISDRKAGEIIRLVASVHLSVCLSTLLRLNRLTYDLDKVKVIGEVKVEGQGQTVMKCVKCVLT